MTASRQTLFAVVLVSLVTSALAVAGALALFAPQSAQSTPGSAAALADQVRNLERKLKALEQEKLDRSAYESGLSAVSERVAAIEKARNALGAPGSSPAASGQPGSPADASDAMTADAMGKAMGEFMKVQLKQGRDRFVNDLVNPGPESQARQQREVRRWANMLAGNLALDETQKDAVEQVLGEVDQSRREKLREIFKSKPIEQITYNGDLKPVIDDSFKDEDERIAQILPPEKADQYKQNAEMIRGLITTMASAAFPDNQNK